MPSSTAWCTTLTGSRGKETACERSQPNDPVLTPHQRCDPMNVPTGQYCPPSIGMVAAFKLESLAGIVGIRIERAKLIQDRAPRRKRYSGIPSFRFDCCVFLFYSFSAATLQQNRKLADAAPAPSRVTSSTKRARA